MGVHDVASNLLIFCVIPLLDHLLIFKCRRSAVCPMWVKCRQQTVDDSLSNSVICLTSCLKTGLLFRHIHKILCKLKVESICLDTKLFCRQPYLTAIQWCRCETGSVSMFYTVALALPVHHRLSWSLPPDELTKLPRYTPSTSVPLIMTSEQWESWTVVHLTLTPVYLKINRSFFVHNAKWQKQNIQHFCILCANVTHHTQEHYAYCIFYDALEVGAGPLGEGSSLAAYRSLA